MIYSTAAHLSVVFVAWVNANFLAVYKYKFKRCSKKECCKQYRYVKFKGTITKWPVLMFELSALYDKTLLSV